MSRETVKTVDLEAGGIRPRPRIRSERVWSFEEREEISRGLAKGRSLRAIAEARGRAPSTVSREVQRGGGRLKYRATTADRRAGERAGRPKPGKLASCPRLRRAVDRGRERRWSPRQISCWLAKNHADDPELQVSHETIYQSLYVQGRGELRQELPRALRTGRATRQPRARAQHRRRSRIPEMVNISERPPEVADRAVPGHWRATSSSAPNKATSGPWSNAPRDLSCCSN